jgi:hypothetical protein
MDALRRPSLPFPKSLPEFQHLFPDDASCATYLEKRGVVQVWVTLFRLRDVFYVTGYSPFHRKWRGFDGEIIRRLWAAIGGGAGWDRVCFAIRLVVDIIGCIGARREPQNGLPA